LQGSVTLARSIDIAALGTKASVQPVLLGKGGSRTNVFLRGTHHRCLGFERGLPYAAARGQKSVNRQVFDELKQ
jgi:hypothetical protein